MNSATIVGYTFNADTLCHDCTFNHFVTEAAATVGSRAFHMDTEQVLSIVSIDRDIDRMDERSFDSEDFPKVIFADGVQPGERCGGCDTELVECSECEGEGWLEMLDSQTFPLPNHFPVQRCGTCSRFETDREAAEYVAREQGSSGVSQQKHQLFVKLPS